MHIYLTHPIHGAKVAISDAEAEYDEKSGWSRYNLDEAPDAPPVNELALKRKYTRKAAEPESATEGI